MICITLVEDDLVAADLLKEYLSAEDLTIINHFTSAEAVIKELDNQPLPDIILMDIGLPGATGITATQNIKQRFPKINIVMLTTFEDTKSIVSAIQAGSSGYLLKASPSQEIITAIKEIHRGGSFLSGSIARKVLNTFQPNAVNVAKDTGLTKLTQREQEILDRLITGESYKIIADKLNISTHTVNNHIRKIYKKMQVHSRAEAVALAMDL